MMNMKFALIICMVLVLSIIGCRSSEEVLNDDSSNRSEYIPILTSENVSNDTEENIHPSSETTTVISEASIESITSSVSAVESTATESVVKPDSDNTSSAVTSIEETVAEDNTSGLPQIQKATAEDSKEIATLVVKYINEYRNSCGVDDAAVLPGLMQYAEYRSRQIVSNFEHDTNDERAAAIALEYGKYTDPADYGVEGEPFYSACASEAIVKTGFSGSKELVAKNIAKLVADSVTHWTYVGHPDNTYIAVGVTYANGVWYCDIAVSDVNYDENIS